jgi:hypothetical protein
MRSTSEVLNYYITRLGRVVVSTLIAALVTLDPVESAQDLAGFEDWRGVRGVLAALSVSIGLIIRARAHLAISPYHTIPYHTIPYHTIPYHTISPDRISSVRARQARAAALSRSLGLTMVWPVVIFGALLPFGGLAFVLLYSTIKRDPGALVCLATVGVADTLSGVLMGEGGAHGSHSHGVICPSYNVMWFIAQLIVFVVWHPAVGALLRVINARGGANSVVLVLAVLCAAVSFGGLAEAGHRSTPRSALTFSLDYGTYLVGAVVAELARELARRFPPLCAHPPRKAYDLRRLIGAVGDLSFLGVIAMVVGRAYWLQATYVLQPTTLPPATQVSTTDLDATVEHNNWLFAALASAATPLVLQPVGVHVPTGPMLEDEEDNTLRGVQATQATTPSPPNPPPPPPLIEVSLAHIGALSPVGERLPVTLLGLFILCSACTRGAGVVSGLLRASITKSLGGIALELYVFSGGAPPPPIGLGSLVYLRAAALLMSS